MDANAKRKKTTPRFFLLLTLLCVAAAAFVFVAQEQKFREIEKETAALQAEYDTLLSEQERLEYMIEYAQSDIYRIQYAREKLGYLDENDIKFQIEE